jgi:predicted nucleic-acid-binding protein
MIRLDTNVLVRYIAQDDPVQSEIATDFIERRLTARGPSSFYRPRSLPHGWIDA